MTEITSLVLRMNRNAENMLTMWFEANKKYPQARETTYLNFPTQWVWNHSSRSWTVRQKGSSIGRLPLVQSNCGERYYLKMLLTKICGASSFQEFVPYVVSYTRHLSQHA